MAVVTVDRLKITGQGGGEGETREKKKRVGTVRIVDCLKLIAVWTERNEEERTV